MSDMTLNEYSALAVRTAQHSPASRDMTGRDDLPLYHTLGIVGEAGEFADKVKKAWRNGTPLDREAALRELGDVLWYVTAAARDLGSSLDEVAKMNISKCADRASRGVIKSQGDDR